MTISHYDAIIRTVVLVCWLATILASLPKPVIMTDQRVVLITGATGLLGRQLLKAFDQAGWKTIGTGFTRARPPSILKVDLDDERAIEQILEDHR